MKKVITIIIIAILCIIVIVGGAMIFIKSDSVLKHKETGMTYECLKNGGFRY